MSGIMEQLAEGRSKNSRRGSTNNTRRLEAFGSGRKQGTADWSSCDAQLMLDVIMGITALGGAVTIGLSRDGGAHSLTLLLDGERQTLWFNGDANLDEELIEVCRVLLAIT